MGKLPHVGNFRDLMVYSKSRELSRDIFEVSKKFPREEMYALTDQIRRSSRSIGAQIAEAWAKRRYENHFLSKLTDADGEQRETQHWLEITLDCEYITPTQAHHLLQKCEEVGRMLGSMVDKSHLFCNNPTKTIREQSPEYFINT